MKGKHCSKCPTCSGQLASNKHTPGHMVPRVLIRIVEGAIEIMYTTYQRHPREWSLKNKLGKSLKILS